MIAVMGATGRAGGAVLAALPPGSAAVALSRTGGAVAGRPGRRFDIADPGSFDAALEGAQALFAMRPPQVTGGRPFRALIGAARRAGVKRVVCMSVHGAGRTRILPHHAMEAEITRGGIPWTLLRPADFMQNLQGPLAGGILRRSEIAVPAGRGRSAFVDVGDVGRAAVAALDEPATVGRAFDLTGPKALTFDAVAAILTRHLNRRIVYRPVGIARFVAENLAQGRPAGMTAVMAALYTVQRLGRAAPVSPDFQGLTGRPATSFDAYVAANRADWLTDQKD